MDIHYWGGKRGGKNWRLKIYPPNVAVFDENLAVFGFLGLATLALTLTETLSLNQPFHFPV